jgi:hypothetical protein
MIIINIYTITIIAFIITVFLLYFFFVCWSSVSYSDQWLKIVINAYT